MAESKKVESKDIIQQDLFAQPKKSADKFADSLDKVVQGFMAILTEQQKFLQQNKGNVKQIDDIKRLNDAINKSKQARLGLAEAQKIQLKLDAEAQKVEQQKQKTTQQKIKTDKEVLSLQQKKNRALQDEKKNTENATKAAEKLKSANEKLNSIYLQESKRLNDLRKQYKDLVLSEKGSETETKKLQEEITKLDKKLKDVDASVGQFNRHVGDYKNQIGEAIKESGIFNGTIGDVVRGLGNLKTQLQENAKAGGGFANAMKLGAVGLGLLLAKLIKELFELDQAVLDNAQITKAWFEDLKNGGTPAQDFVKATIAFRDALRSLQTELQQATLDQQDFNEIAADITIGFEARQAALKEEMRLAKEAAESDVKIAQGKLDILNKEIALSKSRALSGKALEDIIQRQFEAQQDLLVIEDKRDDLLRTQDEDRRRLNIEQAQTEVDLILKKKQSANADKVILEQRLADEKRQLEQRRKDAAQLLAVNKKTTAEEIRIFKEKTGLQFNANALLAEQDAVLLQRKLEGIKQTVINQKGETEQVGIGTEAVVLLAKIIKQAQENQIANAEQIKKLDEEEIKRKQKIADIEKEIVIIQQQSIVEATQESADKQGELSDKANQDILNQEDVFSRKKIKRRKLLADEALKKDKESIDEQIILLELQRDKEIQAANDSINDEKIRAKEIEKIRAKSLEDISKLEADKRAADIEFADKEVEELRKREIRRTEIVVEKLQAVTTALESEVQKQNDKRVEQADKEIADREKAIERQTQLAEDGKENQLAFEIAAQNKAELEKQKIEERAAREQEILQLTDAYFNAFNSRLKEPGANPNTAAFQALGDVLLARGVAKGIAGLFFEGTEMVADDLKGNKVHNGRDGYVIGVDGTERILTGDQNKMIGGMSNDDLAKLAYSYQNGLIKNVSIGGGSTINAQAISLFAEMKEELTAIKNKPVQTWEMNKYGQMVEKIIHNGFTKSTTYIPPYNFRRR